MKIFTNREEKRKNYKTKKEMTHGKMQGKTEICVVERQNRYSSQNK